MTRVRWGAAVLVLLALAAAALAIGADRLKPRGDKPELLVLTSLPLFFSEDFSLDQKSAPIIDVLQSRYRLVPIDVTDPATLAKGKLLMMAQPRAQTATNLVTLDQWVRSGGHVLLFADPALDWPSGKALADPTRPPPMFADTGLLAHWGLRLDAPETRGPTERSLRSREIATTSSGALSGGCRTEDGGLLAYCSPGRGKVIVVADADLLDLDSLGDAGANNGEAILGLLDSLNR